MKEKISNNIQIKNKRATFDYELLDTFTAGIVLTGTEIKSIRLGKASLVDTFCIVEKGELWVKNMYVAEYFYGTYNNHTARRDRKLLLTKKELRKIESAARNNGFTIIPTRLFINDKGLAKVVVAIAKGKKEYDKRDSIKERDDRREMDRAFKRSRNCMDKEIFLNLLKERILILDGGMGTMVQGFKLTEKDYRGKQFADWMSDLKGNNDLLCITRPDVIKSIHRQYLDAGADIFATNTFNANAISMEDYGMQGQVRNINLAAGKLAREVADGFMKEHPDRTIFVAGSVGPTNKTASMSPDVSDPAYRAVTYLDLYSAYKEQVDALVDGGVDIVLFETTFDTLNVKAGLEAAEAVLKEKGKDLPIMLSMTLSAQGGRTFSGQTLLAFLASVQHTNIVSVGLNCSFGAADMKPFLAELAKHAPYYISAYPNAGLPNSFGSYDETPEKMAVHVKSFIDEGLVNILGGCCGTTPAHIAKYPELVKGAKPHVPAPRPDCLWLSGLELLEVKPENNFVNVGERCNVAGSRKFLRLIKEENYEEALTIARKQVEDGAQVIDINMDDGMLDAVKEMTTFLNLIASEPDISRVPVMIDSSKWEVIEKGLMCVQGKSIVNSISLKEGEEVFLQHAARIKQLGAATVVMAFDEKGQADTFEIGRASCRERV